MPIPQYKRRFVLGRSMSPLRPVSGPWEAQGPFPGFTQAPDPGGSLQLNQRLPAIPPPTVLESAQPQFEAQAAPSPGFAQATVPQPTTSPGVGRTGVGDFLEGAGGAFEESIAAIRGVPSVTQGRRVQEQEMALKQRQMSAEEQRASVQSLKDLAVIADTLDLDDATRGRLHKQIGETVRGLLPPGGDAAALSTAVVQSLDTADGPAGVAALFEDDPWLKGRAENILKIANSVYGEKTGDRKSRLQQQASRQAFISGQLVDLLTKPENVSAREDAVVAELNRLFAAIDPETQAELQGRSAGEVAQALEQGGAPGYLVTAVRTERGRIGEFLSGKGIRTSARAAKVGEAEEVAAATKLGSQPRQGTPEHKLQVQAVEKGKLDLLSSARDLKEKDLKEYTTILNTAIKLAGGGGMSFEFGRAGEISSFSLGESSKLDTAKLEKEVRRQAKTAPGISAATRLALYSFAEDIRVESATRKFDRTGREIKPPETK